MKLLKAIWYSLTYRPPNKTKKQRIVCPICKIVRDPKNNIHCMCYVNYVVCKQPGEEYAI